MLGTDIRAAFVSTNSISQGEQVADLWKPLMEGGIKLDFAWRTFRWDSEAFSKAHVHCVIIGFGYRKDREAVLYEETSRKVCSNLNPFLCDAPNVFVESRSKALCSIPDIGIGNKPIDGGFYLFDEDEMRAFICKEPQSERFFRPWYGSQEFLQTRDVIVYGLGAYLRPNLILCRSARKGNCRKGVPIKKHERRYTEAG